MQKTWLHCLGQYLDGSGIENILDDAGVYGENSIKSIFKGLHYNRGVRGHKLLYESIRMLQIYEYLKFCKNSYLLQFLSSVEFNALRESIVDKDSIKVRDTFQKLSTQGKIFLTDYKTFVIQKCSENENFLYFNTYCEMVEILLDSIKADREGNFSLHLTSTRRMLPYFFSMNHPLYARGVSLYINDMMQLPESVKKDLENGMMSVKRKKGIFNSVDCDLGLEQSQNSSSAISGGWIGITQNEMALQKWILLYPIKNSIHESLLSFCNMQGESINDLESFNHNEWSKSQIIRDDQDAVKIINLLKSKNIFYDNEDSSHLRNIHNGTLASDQTRSYLLSLKVYGEELLKKLIEECFIQKEKSVFDRISKVVVKNFNYKENDKQRMTKTKEMQSTKEIIDIQEYVMLFIQRGLTVTQFATHELLSYPKALADADGFFKKPVKSDLMDSIEKITFCSRDYSIINSSANKKVHIFDGMVLVHMMQINKYSTFGEFAASFFNYIVSFFKHGNVSQIHIVFDRYDNIGIKYVESLLRANNIQVPEITITTPNTKIPKNFKILLNNPKNKLELVRFLCQNCYNYFKLSEKQKLFISGGFQDIEKCFAFESDSMYEVKELMSNHLEADTRIFSHASHAIEFGDEIVIHSVDTDVFILAIHFWPLLKSLGCSSLWFKINNQNSRCLACHVVADTITYDLCDVLPALHAFTGCDSTSKVGFKKKALDLLISKKYVHVLKPLGNGLELSYNEFRLIETFYLEILGKKGDTADEARVNIFSRSCGIRIKLANVPCTSDALYLHTLRASAQTYIWKNAIHSQYKELDLTHFGYTYKDNKLLPVFMSKNPLPDKLVKPCNCQKSCKTKMCNCKKNGVSCVPMCGCDLDYCKNII